MSFLREPNAEPIPGYRLIEPLGSGGFGEVWKCEAPGGLFKAIKFVYGNLNSLDAEGVRAEQELHALQRIKEVRHPFVLSNERIEIVEGELVIVMELADKSLHDQYVECQASGLVGIPRDALLRYVRDAAEALDHMIDKHNLLHLDIKPRNLFLISDRVKVADFGLVKHLERTSASGMLGGVTPLYAPPETIQNKISPFSDQYSLAIVYQELLTGQRPFTGKNARQLAMQHLNEDPELRGLPEPERPIVARALAKDPTKRWPNCIAFVRALYTARHPGLAASIETPGNRPKTMADTMEDILLEAPVQPPQEDVPAIAKTRADDDEEIEVSQLGITIAQKQTGALRPTVIIGIGEFGRRALLELRCRFLDRFGEMSKVPLIRLLYVDTDPDAVKQATRGSPEVALASGLVYHLPLQPVANYRRRMLDHLTEWLPREKLYSMPRSLQPQGSRALGRLAFSDNHLRLIARLRREIQQATHPDALYQSVNQTGLALRENVPRVYVVAAAGGSGSGMLTDLAYALRATLKQMRFEKAEIIAQVLCGAPSDPATPPQEQANVYATLTELNHYQDAASHFAAQYVPDSPHVRDEGMPFNSIYLLQLAHRTPESLRDAVAHLGSYLFHDLTTPLGVRLDRARHLAPADGATPYRSFGTFAVWFPRGLMLRLASRQCCARLLEMWESTEPPGDMATIEYSCEKALSEPGLDDEAISERIEQMARVPSEGTPEEALTNLLSHLDEQSQHSVAQEDPGNWARQALAQLQEWIGSGVANDTDSGWRQSRLGRAYANAVQQLTSVWESKLSKVAYAQAAQKGRRLAAVEAALRHLSAFCETAAAEAREKLNAQGDESREVWQKLDQALDGCLSAGGFSFFGGRTKRQLRAFMDQMMVFARQYLVDLAYGSTVQFYLQLRSKFEDRLRELTFCRQRLRHMRERLEAPLEDTEVLAGTDVAPDLAPATSAETYWDMIRESETVRIVLPDGEADLEKAAQLFLDQLKPEHIEELDAALHEQVLAPLGGLHHLCVSSGDLLRGLAGPLTDQTATSLAELLPVTDVAEVEMSAANVGDGDLASRTTSHYAKAAPLIEEKEGANQHAFLLLPASDAGKSLGEESKDVVPALHLVRVPGQADLMYCREQGNLSAEAIQRMLRPFRSTYVKMTGAPTTSPHARFDLPNWMPLDP